MCEAAADDHLVRGVATIAAPSTLRDWAQDPGRLLAHARSMGMIRTEGFPADATRWVRDIGAGRRDRGGQAPRSAARCSCCTGSRTSRCRSTTPARSPTPAAQLGAPAGAGCGPPPAPRPACDRHLARLARPPGAERRLDRDPRRNLNAVRAPARRLAAWRRGRRRGCRRANAPGATRWPRRACPGRRRARARRRRARGRSR